MRIAIVNFVWDADARTPEETLERFTTLTGWADAVAQSGEAQVSVLQRFHRSAELTRGAVSYRFIGAGGSARPPAWFAGSQAMRVLVAAWRPDVVHINGLDYPAAIRRLARIVSPRRAPLVVQDHGGFDPQRLPRARAAWMRWGLGAASALLVATPPQIESFHASGLVPRGLTVRDVMEGSTSLRVDPARGAHTPLRVLWVGRLNAIKDPLTVLRGFEKFVARFDAALTFVYQDAALEPQLRDMLARSDALRARVTLRGAIDRERMADEYAAADLFVLGSRREGSGYAALEALACGVVPVLTDIPSFRWLTDGGRVGGLWRPGDPEALCEALTSIAARPLQPQREAARGWFEQNFSWPAIGRRAAAIYRDLSRL